MRYCDSEYPEQIDILTETLIEISSVLVEELRRAQRELDLLIPAPGEADLPEPSSVAR